MKPVMLYSWKSLALWVSLACVLLPEHRAAGVYLNATGMTPRLSEVCIQEESPGQCDNTVTANLISAVDPTTGVLYLLDKNHDADSCSVGFKEVIPSSPGAKINITSTIPGVCNSTCQAGKNQCGPSACAAVNNQIVCGTTHGRIWRMDSGLVINAQHILPAISGMIQTMIVTNGSYFATDSDFSGVHLWSGPVSSLSPGTPLTFNQSVGTLVEGAVNGANIYYVSKSSIVVVSISPSVALVATFPAPSSSIPSGAFIDPVRSWLIISAANALYKYNLNSLSSVLQTTAANHGEVTGLAGDVNAGFLYTAEKGVTEQRVVQYRTTDMSFQSSVVYSVPVTDNTKISSASAYISSDNTVAYTYFAGSKYVEGVSLSGCAPGRFFNASNTACSACRQGSFSDSIGRTECGLCPAGTANNLFEGNSVTVCIPCAVGSSAANPGSSTCQSCASASVCPLGSISPLPANTGVPTTGSSIQTVMPLPLQPNTGEVSDKQRTIYIISTLVVAVLVGIALLVRACCRSSVDPKIAQLDGVFDTRHMVPEGESLRRRRTATGGLCSLTLVIYAVCIVVALTIEFRDDNKVETATFQALGVESQLRGQEGRPPLTSLAATVTAYGVAGCPSTNFSTNIPYNVADATITKGNGTLSCSFKFACTKCPLVSSSTLTFTFNDENFKPSSFSWIFEAGTGRANSQALLRGATTASSGSVYSGSSTVKIVDVITYYKNQISSEEGSGYFLNFRTYEPLTSVTAATFYTHKNFEVVFDAEQFASEQSVVVSERQTMNTFIANLAGSLAGLVGLLGALMVFMESCALRCRSNEDSTDKDMQDSPSQVPMV